MSEPVEMVSGVPEPRKDVHLCDNYVHLLLASADLAGRPGDPELAPATILFIDDQLDVDDDLAHALTDVTGTEIIRVSDRDSINAFATLPGFLPQIVRRNVSWSRGWRPIGPSSWTPSFLSDQHFDTGYVYHPGFFLSKVVAGHCRRVVMRDSGYANYVTHRVPWTRVVPRLLAGRHPFHQVWGEEPWVDEIEVVRPDQLPPRVRNKASRVTLDQFMARLAPDRAQAIAAAFWGDEPLPTSDSAKTALVLTQPVDQLGICTRAQKEELYRNIADRLRREGYRIVVKPHPREEVPPLNDHERLPAPFPIEAWVWLGQAPFDLAVSLNSASLSDREVSFARDRLQLIPPNRFYRRYWPEWSTYIAAAFERTLAVEAGGPMSRTPMSSPQSLAIPHNDQSLEGQDGCRTV